jgi:acetate kinase
MSDVLITINTGSSSIKAAVYASGGDGPPLSRIDADRVDSPGATMLVSDAGGTTVSQEPITKGGFDGALEVVAGRIERLNLGTAIGVGHRVVHGGREYFSPQRVEPAMLDHLRELVPVDPEHLPQAIAGIETMSREFPQASQVVCFDTGFHRDMPRFAQLYGLPYALAEDGILRYGFHGLSFESIVRQLRAKEQLLEKLVVAHLGNGASIAAIRGGRSTDTTMGFSPTGGLVMGTRSGDLDPGVLVYLLESRGMDVSGLSRLVNRESGLLGLSGSSSDMRDLLLAEAGDERASMAVEVYCYVARKQLAAMAAALDGVDLLVFTGGIGEHSAEIRKRICSGLGFLGVALDDRRNGTGAGTISSDGTVTVMVVPSDEDGMIARHTAEVLGTKDTEHVRV